MIKDNNKNSSGRIVSSGSQAKGVTKSAVVTGIEGGISSALSDIPKAVPLAINRALRRAGLEFMVPVKGANVLRGIGSVERVGAVGVVFTGAAVWDDFHSGYSSSEAWGRTGIDVGVSATVILFGLSNPVGWTVLFAVGVGMTAEVAENQIWKKD
ncbi:MULTISPECIES: hypothetical protein [Clostridium]|uniref:hypothetical protein n=1 Tax=Clostridium TaxID=1485 RepID=UPI00069CD333|nr:MULTISPECIES: hypothetical protein [Clostridium]KOF55768.1 hypothetical protein AGR56_18320 [Clostridium sp. DMHC 10]MCD2349055.1 hypothetical protein [Clostridium guangxiense]